MSCFFTSIKTSLEVKWSVAQFSWLRREPVWPESGTWFHTWADELLGSAISKWRKPPGSERICSWHFVNNRHCGEPTVVTVVIDHTFLGKPTVLVWGLDQMWSQWSCDFSTPSSSLVSPFLYPCCLVECYLRTFVSVFLVRVEQSSVEEVRTTMSLWTVGMLCDWKRVINVGGRGRTNACGSWRGARLCTLCLYMDAWNSY